LTADATLVNPGLVTFCDATAAHCLGLAVVGTAQLTSDGTATLRFTPGGGSHSYHAVFAGTATYTTSTSPPQAATVLSPTTTSIASSGTVGNYTLTATVAATSSFTGPTGSVSFIDMTNGNSLLGTATLGTATLGQDFANASESPIAVGDFPVAVAVGDFNGDGIADLAVTNQRDNTVSILLGDGHGGFTPATPVAVGSFPGPVAVGDFDGDGHADLAVVNITSNNVSILLGNGTGGFSSAALVPVGSGPYAVAVGDFNGDGIADLAVPNYLSNNLSVLLNQVTQTATAMVTGVSVPGSGTTHDVNATYAGDTNFDSSTSSTIPLTTSPVATTTLLELSTAGTITFGTPVTLTANITPYSVNGLTATGTMSFSMEQHC
jgi:FG-GAP-like repeat/Bacterial Ig-like domain (group 3)/FG-GAP repeat